MREPPRRRRLDDEPSGGLPLFPLILVVVLAGLLLGGVLAHFFGGSNGSPAAPKNVAVAPLPTATPLQPLASPSPSVTSAARRTPTPAPSITPSPKTSLTPKPVATSKRVAVATPRSSASPGLTPAPTPAAATAKPVAATAKPVAATAKPAAATAKPPAATPVAVAGTDDRATSVVRSYLQALSRGDRPGAAAYLAHGTPSETFMGSGSHIESIRSASVGPQAYKVTADVQTASGEYYVTFTLERGPAGLQITDHYAIKTQ